MEVDNAALSLKRRASNELAEQRLAKRFDLLNIDNRSGEGTHKLYIPVSPSIPPSKPGRQDGLEGDHMSLDDSKHKVYIYDLDAELSDAESDAEKPIFIPDIEKHLNRLPKLVLMGDDARDAYKNMQMVLYSLPASLTVAEEQDSVRKAILESRARQRERAAVVPPASSTGVTAVPHAAVDGVRRERARSATVNATSPSSPGALVPPALTMEGQATRATMYGTAAVDTNPHAYDPDAMDMD